jgi:hypothetical protein
MDSWIDPTGDDFALIHDEGRLLAPLSRPAAFGPPRFVYEHRGALIEIIPTVTDDGFSAWKLTRRIPA